MTPQEKRDRIMAAREEIGQIMLKRGRPPAFTKAQREAAWSKAEGRCTKCRDELLAGWPVDHIKPWGDGGEHTLGNWQALCKPCHIAKTGPENRTRAKPNRLLEIEINGRKRAEPPIPQRQQAWQKGRKLQSRSSF